MILDVYTDGGCLHNGHPHAIAAYGYYFPDFKDMSFAGRVPSDQPQTNNRGELLGILEAIKKARSFPDCNLRIFTDSEYAKNCITKWSPAWIARGWKTTTGTPVVNRDLIEEILNLVVCFESYTISYVKAHTGLNDNNHIVDRMVAAILSPPPPPIEPQPVAGPLQLMGPPVSETVLVNWCMDHIAELDPDAVRSALVSAYTKTMTKNGYEVIKHKHHRSVEYRLSSGNHIIINK